MTANTDTTIIQSDPQTLVSTGYNLYNHTLGYAIGLKYSDTYGFRINGTYTAVKYSATLTGEKSTITPADGLFTIPANGYIWVEGGNNTDTEVYMTWADWQLGREGSFAAYTQDVIDLSEIMAEYFPYGLLRVGDIRDEIDMNTGMAISNVQRLAYSAENLATAEASGRVYEYDTNYIYLERATAVTDEIEIDGQYDVSDHGLEYFTGTDISVYAIIIYGNNLKNKLERDVVTKSADIVNGFDSTATDKALSANAGKLLNEHIGNIINAAGTYEFDCICAGYNSGSGNYVDFFAPMMIKPGLTITSAKLKANSSIFYGTTRENISSETNVSATSIQRFGVYLEMQYSSSRTANVLANVHAKLKITIS